MFPWNFFPFNKDMKKNMEHMKSEDIDKFIQGILGNVMSSHTGGMLNPENVVNKTRSQTSQHRNSLNSTAFETHDSVFVRIPILDETWLKQMRIFHTSNQLIVEHIPEKSDKHSITLPSIVKKKGSSAKYKDGILEIRLIKSHDMQYSQIDVTEL